MINPDNNHSGIILAVLLTVTVVVLGILALASLGG